jgi:1-phosphatidylinositol-3-phosphate 5-kinase
MLPDPDQEDVAWSEPEAFSAVITRKEHPKDSTTLLAFREVLRQKSPVDTPGSGILAATSRLGAGTSTGGSTPKAGGSVHIAVKSRSARYGEPVL